MNTRRLASCLASAVALCCTFFFLCFVLPAPHTLWYVFVITHPTIRWFFQQLVQTMDYFHAKGVAHRDIKLENTLLQVSTTCTPLEGETRAQHLHTTGGTAEVMHQSRAEKQETNMC